MGHDIRRPKYSEKNRCLWEDTKSFGERKVYNYASSAGFRRAGAFEEMLNFYEPKQLGNNYEDDDDEDDEDDEDQYER